MTDPALALPTPRRKVHAFTRKKLHRRRAAEEKARKRDAKRSAQAAVRAARRPDRSLAVFEGTDPERTLALLGEEW